MTGELDAWDFAAARANHRLVQVVYEADSTGAGQTNEGTVYSPLTRVRERLAGAEIPDGGHGVMNGTLDVASVSGEPEDAGVLIEPVWNITGGFNLKGNYTGATNIDGEVYQAAVYAQRIRVSFARYSAPTTVDIDIDGSTERMTIPAMGTAGGTGDTNWQAGYRYFKDGFTYGRHVVTVTLVSGWLSCLIEGTRNTGVVLHNFGARGEQAVGVPWHQFQDWAGLTVTNTAPVVPTTLDATPGSHATVLGIYAKGGNDQQGYGGTDTSDAYAAKAYDFARAFTENGKSAVILSPWWESFGQNQLAANFRAASIEAAEQAGALWLDLGTEGALEPLDIVGTNNGNPHLPALYYEAQGDYIADALLANYSGQVGPTPPQGDSNVFRVVGGELVAASVYGLVDGQLVARSLGRATN